MSLPLSWMTTHGDTVEVYYSPSFADVTRTDAEGFVVSEEVETPGWRYRVRAANNKVVEWGESYTRRRAAVRAAERHHPRHTVSDVVVGQLWRSSDEPNPDGEGLCVARSPGESGYLCCRRAGHTDPHIAGNGTRAVAVWP